MAFPLLAWCLQRQRVTRGFKIAVPLVFVGVALVGGLGGGVDGSELPTIGVMMGGAAGLAYAAYLYVSRQGNRNAPGHTITGLTVASVTATAASAAIALPTTGLDFDLSVMSWFWLILLAVFGQAGAWLMVGAASSRLPAHTTAMLLALHPVVAVLLAVGALGETLSPSQVGGGLLVLIALLVTSTGRPSPSTRRPFSHPTKVMHRSSARSPRIRTQSLAQVVRGGGRRAIQPQRTSSSAAMAAAARCKGRIAAATASSSILDRGPDID
ncbi:MAG: DMT family transporter, partial [Ornithinimicrobium sp.]